MFKLESLGSYWFVDEELKTYTRTPKRERPRDNPEHTGEGTPLHDLNTFLYKELELVDLPPGNWWEEKYGGRIPGCARFIINEPRLTPLGYKPWVHAPMNEEQYNNAKEILSV